MTLWNRNLDQTVRVPYAYIKQRFSFGGLKTSNQNLYRKLLSEKAVTGKAALLNCLPQATEITSAGTEVHSESTTGLGTGVFIGGSVT